MTVLAHLHWSFSCKHLFSRIRITVSLAPRNLLWFLLWSSTVTLNLVMGLFFLHLKNSSSLWCQYRRYVGQRRLWQANNMMQWLAFIHNSPYSVERIFSGSNLMDVNSITTAYMYFLILPFLVYLHAIEDFLPIPDSLCLSFFIYKMN